MGQQEKIHPSRTDASDAKLARQARDEIGVTPRFRRNVADAALLRRGTETRSEADRAADQRRPPLPPNPLKHEQTTPRDIDHPIPGLLKRGVNLSSRSLALDTRGPIGDERTLSREVGAEAKRVAPPRPAHDYAKRPLQLKGTMRGGRR